MRRSRVRIALEAALSEPVCQFFAHFFSAEACCAWIFFWVDSGFIAGLQIEKHSDEGEEACRLKNTVMKEKKHVPGA